MSNVAEELKNGRYIVGDDEYFKDINEDTFLKVLMKNTSKADYSDTMNRVHKNIERAVDEVYNDLETHSRILRYLDERNRNELLEVVEGFDDAARTIGGSIYKISSCKDLLRLRSSDTNTFSGKSESDIKKAVERSRESATYISDSNKKKLIDNLASYGPSGYRFKEEEEKYLDYIDDRNRSKEFYKDIKNYIKYKIEKEKVSGKNGQYFPGSYYIEKIEEMAFGSGYDRYVRGYDYKDAIKKAFEEVGKQMEKDILSAKGRKDVYLCDYHKNETAYALKELKKCGVSLSSNVDRVLKEIKMSKTACEEIYFSDMVAKSVGKKLSDLKPSSGVIGVKIGGELGSGYVGSLSALFVIDENGEYGVVGAFGVGVGIGSGIIIDKFETRKVSSIHNLVNDYLFPVTISLNVGFAGMDAELEFDRDGFDKQDLRLPKLLPNEYGLAEEIVKKRTQKKSYKAKVSANVQIYFRGLKYMGKLRKEYF